MRKLVVLILMFFTLYGGYWFVGSGALQKGMVDFLTREHGENADLQVKYADLSVRGFPSRFDTRISDITLTDRPSGIIWRAPFFDIYALSYKPYHIIASLPHEQSLRLPDQVLQIGSDEIKGSVIFEPKPLIEPALIIDRSSFVLRNLVVKSSKAWESTIESGHFAIRQTPANPQHYDLAVSLQNVTLPDTLRDVIDPARQQPALFDSLKLDSTLALTDRWNLLDSGKRATAISEIAIKDFLVIWNDLRFQAEGTLQIDKSGQPEGRLNLTATNWQKMYQLAEKADAINPDFAQTIQNGLKVLANMSEGEDVIEIPLVFSGGQMSLGPFPIGPAPRLH